MTREEAQLLLQSKAPETTVPPEVISGLHTDARPAPGHFPLVVLSPDLTLPRATLTSLAEELTSHGYVVALVDHTYESTGTTFPDGRTLTCVICDQPPDGGPATIPIGRARDISFVLDQITDRHAVWRHARLIDPERIGIAGHSIGGTQADHAPGRDHTWDRDWPYLDGWKRWLTVAGAQHTSFTDAPILEHLLGIPDSTELPAHRALEITRTYITAFFDLHLKSTPQPILNGTSTNNPEVTFEHP
jgi:hypothetical protein